jgi:hypothetical protein
MLQAFVPTIAGVMEIVRTVNVLAIQDILEWIAVSLPIYAIVCMFPTLPPLRGLLLSSIIPQTHVLFLSLIHLLGLYL